MLTATSEVTGNPDRAGNMLKVISMRLRNATNELVEMGEEVDPAIQTATQLQAQVLNLTHGKVNIFEDNGDFKSTYQILKEISEVYDQLSDIEQADLLEKIAGKQRASDVIALLRNFEQAEKATQSAYNAEGSAMEEYSIHLDTLQASLNTLSSTWQEFSNIFLNSKFLKGGIDTLSTLLDLFGKLVDTVGVLPTLLGGLSIVGSFKNKGFFKLIEDDATKSGKRIENAFFNTFSNIKSLMSNVKNPYAFSDVFSTNLNNDIVSLNKFIKAVSQGESKNVALVNYMQMSSNSAKEFANSIDVSTLATKNASEVMDICSSSTKEFETQQKMAQISIVANGNSLTKTKQLIDEYQGGLKNCGVSQQQFLTAVQATNPQLANYLSGLNGANGSLKGYIRSLISTKLATIGLQIATTALNMAITMGLSVAISALVSKIDELYVSEEEARKQAEEDLQVANEQVEKNKERVNSLDELINKYKELKNSVNDSPETRSEILNVQKEIVSLVGEEAYNLDLVGGKLDENLSKLKEYRKKLLEEKSNSILEKLNKTQDKNQKNKKTEKISTFNSGYDLVGEISYDDYRSLKKSKIDFNSSTIAYTNSVKVGFASDVNEFTKKEIKSTADALKYYKQVREEWIKSYSKDKKISKVGAEFELSNNSLFKKLDKKIQELKNQANEERQLAQEYIDEQFTGLSEYDNELSKIKVKSADDYQDYVKKFTKKILDNKNIKQFIKDGYFSEDDIRKGVENYISGLDQIGAYTDNWKKKYKNIETNITFSKESLDKVKSDIETFYSAIEESMSDTGLTDDTINKIQAMYSELKDYDASKLFERTAVGIKLNRTELERLQEQYNIQNKSAIHSNLRDLLIEYDDLKKKISECTDEEKKAELQSQLDSKDDEIEQVKDLASQYDALTSAYYKWIKAQSTPNEGDAYDSFVDNLSKVAEIYKKGMIGTDDFQTSVQMMTNEDLSGKTAQEIAKVYQEKLPIVKKFFKEGTTGCENFLKSVEALNKGWATQNKDGSWKFNFDNEKLAKELGISVDLVELLLDKLKGLGFNVNLDYALDDIDSLNKLAKDANKTLKDLGTTDTSFTFNTKDIKVANSEISKAQKLLDDFKNDDDGTIDLRMKGASEAQTVLTALIRNRQELEKPTIMNVELDESELQTNYGKAVNLIQDLNNQADELEINLKTGRDTSTTKKNIQKTIKEINNALDKLSEKDLLKLGIDDIDVDAIKNRLSYIDANIKAGVDVDDDSIGLIKTTLGLVEPEINAKVKVDETEVENFKNKDKHTKSTHKVKVDKKEVDKFKKAKHKVKSVLEYGLVKSFELANFMIHPPKLKGVIEFTAEGISNIATEISNLFNGDKKDKSSKKDKSKKGKGSVDGTAHVNGSAFANGKRGDWRVGSSGKSLVGELGKELVVIFLPPYMVTYK